MSENSSADSAALRRQVRRRRILENSEKRLRSITGRPVSGSFDAEQESDNCLLHDFQNAHESDAMEEQSQNVPSTRDAGTNFPPYNPPVIDAAEDDITNHLRESGNFGSNWMKSLVQRRLHLIILSFIVQLMYIFKLGHLFYNNLFCPFIAVKLMEFLMVHEPFEMDIQEQVVLMSAMFKGSMARHLLKACFIVAAIASDFFFYIFMIVASDKLLNIIITSNLG